MVFDEGKVSGNVLGMDLTDDPYVVDGDTDLYGSRSGEEVVEPLGETSADGTWFDAQLAEEDFADVKGRVLPSPSNPIQSQDGDHRAEGHIPFRSWCSECVRARRAGEQHRRRSGTRVGEPRHPGCRGFEGDGSFSGTSCHRRELTVITSLWAS